MIQKIISIKNIGKFLDFQSSGDISFQNETIIFGKNANGKSTLTANISFFEKQ